MILNLGLGGRAGGGAAVFDPASLALTGWWRANSTTGWDSATFDGVASAGSSGSRDLTAGTAPASRAFSGHQAPDFNGSTHWLQTTLTLDDFINSNAFSVWCLFYADAAVADPGDANLYSSPQFFTDKTNAYFDFGFTDGGVHLSCNGCATVIQIAAATGGLRLAQGKYDGTNLKLRVDGGARTSVASTGPAVLTTEVRMGGNYVATPTQFFDGCIVDFGITDSTLSDADEDNVKSYINARWGTAF